MNINRRFLGFLFFLSLLLSLSFSPRANSLEFSNCLPQGIRHYEILANYENLYLLQYQSSEEGELRQLLVQRRQNGCDWVMGNQELNTQSLQNFLSINVARQLTWDRYQRMIQKFGLETVRLSFSNDDSYRVNDTVSFIFPEDKWALDRLGIEIGDQFIFVESSIETEAADPTLFIED